MDCMKNRFQSGVLLDDRYETLHELNHGSFGMVFKARDVVENKLVALKCLTKSANGPSVDDGREELIIHKTLGSHPNIVDLVHQFETRNHAFLVLEFCSNGDLFEAIHAERGPRQTEKVREMMLQLIDAVEHMHARGVYHRDIKPENIFLSESGAVKLGDFGLATMDAVSTEQAVGSDRYMAPEQYDPAPTGYSPAKADAWAVGICLLNILFGKNPFDTPTENDRCFSDFCLDRNTLFDVFDRMALGTFKILTHLLAVDPEARSLAAAREAVLEVDFFTTDDESTDDEFLMNSPPKGATVNREPLRTPSISSPQIEQGGAFPWSRALALNVPMGSQLSAIPDEDMFPYDTSYAASKATLADPPVPHADNASIVSFVDSGLGVSLKSSTASLEHTKLGRSVPMPIAAKSVPSKFVGSLAAVFGKKKPFESRSWSDMIEDDDDDDYEYPLELSSISDFEMDEKTTPLEKTGSSGFMSDGSDTPRAVPRDAQAIAAASDDLAEPGLFDFEQHTEPTATKADKPSAAKRLFDKWQALGDRRRAVPTTAVTTTALVGGPVGALPELDSDKSTPTPTPSETAKSSLVSWNRRYRVSQWRKPREWNVWGQGQQQFNYSEMNLKEQPKMVDWSVSSPTMQKEWNRSTDWRRH